jgi:two-component system chemotaxis sensor kinase CheA
MVKNGREEFLTIYFEEAEELLRDVDERLGDMRRDPTSAATLQSLRRVAHTIKSSAGLMGFENIKTYARALETVMRALEDGDVEAGDVIDLVCVSFRLLRAANAELEDTGRVNESAIAEQTRALEDLLLKSP